MLATESEKDYLMFRKTLTKLERLVDVRGIIFASKSKTTIGESIIYTLELLTEFDVNTSESNAIEELERLAMLKQ